MATGRRPSHARPAARLWLAWGIALGACSGGKPLLRVDVTGDQAYNDVSLRLAAGPSLDRTFPHVTFGPTRTFLAGLFLNGVTGAVTLLGEADDGQCIRARGSMMIPDVEKVVGAVALRLTVVPGCEPPRGDAGVDAAMDGDAGTSSGGSGGSGSATGGRSGGTGGSGTGGGAGNGGRGGSAGTTDTGGSGGAGGTGVSDAGADTAVDSSSGGTGGAADCLPAGDAGVTSPPDAGLALVADTNFGFSGTQGACSWSYGYQLPATDNAFHLMTDWDAAGPLWWVQRGTYWTLVGPDVQHANGTVTTGGRSPIEQWSVRRWTSTVSGGITISGSVRKTVGGGNGVDARIVVDGVVKYSQVIDGPDSVGVSFVVTAPVVVGSTVDFVLDPHLSNDSADTTSFPAQIWK